MIKKIFSGILSGCLLFGMLSCSQLQGTLSSTQNKEMAKAAGTASLSGKNWYYNGIAGENMSEKGIALGDSYIDQSLKISFSKKVALGDLAGSLVVSYLDENNYQVSKTITDLQGTFSDDYEAFFLDMNKVIQLLDGVHNPSGVATVELKVSGFYCAEGKQSGRPIAALEEKITVRPLFATKTVDFSTCWYIHGKSQIVIPVNAPVKLVEQKEAYSVTKEGYKFEITADDEAIYIEPKTDVKGLVTSFNFPIAGILPDSCGNAYTQNFVVNLVDKAIVIDGKKDSNYESTANGAVTVEDAAGDQSAFGHEETEWVGGMPDITSVSIVNDDENLYVGVGGTMAFNWNDKLVVMICKKGEMKDATSSNYKPAENTSFWGGRPGVYLYHLPGYENSGKGSFGALLGEAKTSIGASCQVAPYGWTDNTNGDFIEYAIPLNSVGFAKGDELQIIAVASLKWDEGLAACDTVPDAAIRKEADGKTTMQFDFGKAIEYKVR